MISSDSCSKLEWTKTPTSSSAWCWTALTSTEASPPSMRLLVYKHVVLKEGTYIRKCWKSFSCNSQGEDQVLLYVFRLNRNLQLANYFLCSVGSSGICQVKICFNWVDLELLARTDATISPLFLKQVTVNGERVIIPYSSSLFEITAYGEIMHEIKFSHLGHNLTFTPRNNEFILRLNSKSFSSGTKGLCGKFES